MKELSIKEKAKRYDEALKVLHKYDGANIMFSQSLKEEMFPELSEESEDERISRKLVEYFLHYPDHEITYYGLKTDSVIAWLEKQSEHKKFRDSIQVGDKVTRNEDGVLVNLSQLKRVAKPADKQGEQKPNPCDGCINRKGCINCENGELRETEHKSDDKVEPKFREGDWVVYTGYLLKDSGKEIYVMQVASVEDDRYYFTDTSTLCFDSEKDMRLWTIEDAKDGDVLTTDDGNICVFDGTVEDGKYPFAYCGFTGRRFESYDRRLPFTHDNVHPATKEQYDTLMKAMADAGYTFNFEKKELKKIEQKPAWSEEDEKLVKNLISTLSNLYARNLIEKETKEKYTNLLKSLKDRVQSQPKQEWSDVDKDILFRTIDSLKFLKDTISTDPNYAVNIIDIEREITWLKSLRHQNKWKPSDEQMEALNEALCHVDDDTAIQISMLIGKLKKL